MLQIQNTVTEKKQIQEKKITTTATTKEIKKKRTKSHATKESKVFEKSGYTWVFETEEFATRRP